MSVIDDANPFRGGYLVDVSVGNHLLPKSCRGFYVGNTAGTVSFITSNGDMIDLQVAANTYHPWFVRSFLQAGTTAGHIRAGR